MFSISRVHSHFLCRLLAAVLLLTQFSLVAQASAAPTPHGATMHMVNCGESSGKNDKNGPQCPVQVCLQNLTQTDKPVSAHTQAAATTQPVRSVLFVVPVVSASVFAQQRLVLLPQHSDPPLAIRFCSFQI